MVEPNCSHDISTPKCFFSILHLLPGAVCGHTSYYKKSILFYQTLQFSPADLWQQSEVQHLGQRHRSFQLCNYTHSSWNRNLFQVSHHTQCFLGSCIHLTGLFFFFFAGHPFNYTIQVDGNVSTDHYYNECLYK